MHFSVLPRSCASGIYILNTSFVTVVFVSPGIFIFYCLFWGGLHQQLNRNLSQIALGSVNILRSIRSHLAEHCLLKIIASAVGGAAS